MLSDDAEGGWGIAAGSSGEGPGEGLAIAGGENLVMADALPALGESVTLLLRSWRLGDGAAGQLALSQLYPQLRRLAARELALERAGCSLEATELVHEVYLRLARARQPDWESRGHFFAIVSRLVRQVLVDRARLRRSRKRDWGERQLSPELAELEAGTQVGGAAVPPLAAVELAIVDQAIARLTAADPTAAEVVELRYFCGLTVEETAHALGLGRATVDRKWRAARAFLLGHLQTAPAQREAVAP